MSPNVLVESIRSTLRSAADAERGAGAGLLEVRHAFLGCPGSRGSQDSKGCSKAVPVTSPAELQKAVLELWRNAEAREERYAAIDLTGLRMVKEDLQMIPPYMRKLSGRVHGGTSSMGSHIGSARFFLRTGPR